MTKRTSALKGKLKEGRLIRRRIANKIREFLAYSPICNCNSAIRGCVTCRGPVRICSEDRARNSGPFGGRGSAERCTQKGSTRERQVSARERRLGVQSRGVKMLTGGGVPTRVEVQDDQEGPREHDKGEPNRPEAALTTLEVPLESKQPLDLHTVPTGTRALQDHWRTSSKETVIGLAVAGVFP